MPAGAAQYGLDNSPRHDLNVAANKRLEISLTGVEHHRDDFQSFVFEKAFVESDVERQERDVNRRNSDDNFGRAAFRREADSKAPQLIRRRPSLLSFH